ncbi:MAG: hypothetical protein ABSF71_37715 [Terriglobia bacterium]|jgi:hypothetical protein
MGKIRWTRVLLGGLVAGFVINVFFLGPGLGAAHLPWGLAPREIVVVTVLMVVLVFLVTILVTWLYAALRSRYGPGLRTAAMAGVVSGLLLGLFQYVGWVLTLRLIPARVWATIIAITFAALVIATLLGAWVYEKPSS